MLINYKTYQGTAPKEKHLYLGGEEEEEHLANQ